MTKRDLGMMIAGADLTLGLMFCVTGQWLGLVIIACGVACYTGAMRGA